MPYLGDTPGSSGNWNGPAGPEEGRGSPLSGGERALTSLLVVLSTLSLAGLLLALIGHYAHLPVALVSACALGGLFLYLRPAGPGSFRSLPWPEVLLCLLALFLFSRPGQNVLGNWDPGVYLGQGAALARTGGLILPDPGSRELLPAEKDALYPRRNTRMLKYPGFYAGQGKPHTLQPQFYPLFPVWLAHLQLFGRWAPLYAPGLFALLSVVLAVFVGRELGGRFCGFLSGMLLLLNPVQLWFSGFQTSEVPMQTFFLAAVWSWLVWRRTGSRGHALLAGILLGQILFVSVTGWLLAGLVAAGWAVGSGRGRGAWLLYVALAVMVPLAAWQNLRVAGAYLSDVFRHLPALQSGVVKGWPILLLVMAGVGLGYAVTRVRGDRRAAMPRFIPGLLATLAALAVYGYAKSTGHNVLPLMLSYSGLALGVAGLVLLAARQPRLGLALAVVVLGFTAPFAFRPMMVGQYPWAFKRHLVVALPMCAILAAYAWASLAALRPGRTGMCAVACLALLLGCRPLYRGRTFALQRDWRGMTGLVDAVARDLPDDAVVFARKWLATPLEMYHGKRLVPLYDDARAQDLRSPYSAVIDRLLKAGRPVYRAVQEGEVPDLPFAGQPVGRYTVTAAVLEQSRVPFSNRVREKTVTVVVERLSASMDATDGH